MNSAKICVKLEYQSEIHRLISLADNYFSLLGSFNKYYPEQQYEHEIHYKTSENEVKKIEDEDSFQECLNYIREKDIKSIKFQFSRQTTQASSGSSSQNIKIRPVSQGKSVFSPEFKF